LEGAAQGHRLRVFDDAHDLKRIVRPLPDLDTTPHGIAVLEVCHGERAAHHDGVARAPVIGLGDRAALDDVHIHGAERVGADDAEGDGDGALWCGNASLPTTAAVGDGDVDGAQPFQRTGTRDARDLQDAGESRAADQFGETTGALRRGPGGVELQELAAAVSLAAGVRDQDAGMTSDLGRGEEDREGDREL